MYQFKLLNPNNSEEYISLNIEKSLVFEHCQITIKIQLESKKYSFGKFVIHLTELFRIANWFENMPNNSSEYPDLNVIELQLRFYNYFFEKGDGIYNITFNSEHNSSFSLQLWEQIGNSNFFYSNQLKNIIRELSN